MLCVAVIVAWALAGPAFGFSDAWQLLINTGATTVTFLMVLLIQNRDGVTIRAKLDELVRASAAQTVSIGIERLTQEAFDEILAR